MYFSQNSRRKVFIHHKTSDKLLYKQSNKSRKTQGENVKILREMEVGSGDEESESIQTNLL